MYAKSVTIEVRKERSQHNVIVRDHLEGGSTQSISWGKYPSRKKAVARAEAIKGAMTVPVTYECAV